MRRDTPASGRQRPLLLLSLLLHGCGTPQDSGGSAPARSGDTAAPQDIESIDLSLDLAVLVGKATLVVVPSRGKVVLDVHGLDLSRVALDGEEVPIEVRAGSLTIAAPGSPEPVTVGVSYTFPARKPATFDGWMPSLGVSFVWPTNCGNFFPCDPSLQDGVTFTMNVTGVDEGKTAIYPASTHGDGPAYMAAVAVGQYTKLDLGVTSAGTTLSAWYLPGAKALEDAVEGTAHLVAAFDYFEQSYGPYHFGSEAGTVEVDWGLDSWGGMEHHPFFHVGKFDFNDEEAQVHEAGHGWFGDGVRIACWEDFVLSEGTTTYIAARALEQVGGPSEWDYYVDDFLVPICEGNSPDPTLVNTIVLPDTCGALDFEESDLWSITPYMKGACFYEEVADVIGPDELDAAIGEFYRLHVGEAVHMRDMLDLLRARAAAADRPTIDALVNDWLLSFACPEDYARRCRTHGN